MNQHLPIPPMSFSDLLMQGRYHAELGYEVIRYLSNIDIFKMAAFTKRFPWFRDLAGGFYGLYQKLSLQRQGP